jgi:hypothetical protein
MNNKPKALELADALDIRILPMRDYCLLDQEAAAELRRLHAVDQQRDELFDALKAVRLCVPPAQRAIVNAAIAKCGGAA